MNQLSPLHGLMMLQLMVMGDDDIWRVCLAESDLDQFVTG